MRLASFVPTTARPSLPTVAVDVVNRGSAPMFLPERHIADPGRQFIFQLSIEEFVRLARNAGAL